MSRPFVHRHEPLLGTSVEVRITCASEIRAAEVDAAVVGEIERLEELLTAFRPASEFSRWRRNEVEQPGAEVRDVLRLAAEWCTRSGGAFHPAVEALTALWTRAAADGCEPDDASLANVVRQTATLPYRVDGDRVERLGPCDEITVHAIAKGWIVDRAAALADVTEGVEAVTVNAGGDLVHVGSGELLVGIEDPFNPYDNARPLAVVAVAGEGLATSGSARRGFQIGGRRRSHVIDPRTGRPVDGVPSVTVIAADAATADVVATIVGVLGADEGMRFVATTDNVGCCIIDAAGTVTTNGPWNLRQRSAPISSVRRGSSRS